MSCDWSPIATELFKTCAVERIDAQIAQRGYCLAGERLVEFDHIELIDGDAVADQQLARRLDRSCPQ